VYTISVKEAEQNARSCRAATKRMDSGIISYNLAAAANKQARKLANPSLAQVMEAKAFRSVANAYQCYRSWRNKQRISPLEHLTPL
jgi:hypothetical protein